MWTKFIWSAKLWFWDLRSSYEMLCPYLNWVLPYEFDRISYVESDREMDSLCRLIMCLWGIWNARNRWLFTGKFVDPKHVAATSREFLSSYQHSIADSRRKIHTSIESPRKWLPPAIGWFMLNTDASYQSKEASYGYTLRNHHGRILQSGAEPLFNIVSAEHAELMAIWKSFSEIQVFWETPIEIATDCNRLVLQMNQPDTVWTGLGSVLDGLRRYLNHCNHWKITFCSRSINQATHKLTRIGLSLDSSIN